MSSPRSPSWVRHHWGSNLRLRRSRPSCSWSTNGSSSELCEIHHAAHHACGRVNKGMLAVCLCGDKSAKEHFEKGFKPLLVQLLPGLGIEPRLKADRMVIPERRTPQAHVLPLHHPGRCNIRTTIALSTTTFLTGVFKLRCRLRGDNE